MPPELNFFDITDQFPIDTAATTAEEMLQYSMAFDSCSFTVQRLGLHILLLVS